MIITNISKRMTRVGLLLVLFLAQSALSSAQVELSIEDFTIQSGEQKEVSLLLNNDKKVAGLQVTIDLPTNLEYVPGSVKKTSRITGRGASVQASDATGELVILETDGSIAAGEGAVITFTLEAKAALAEGDHYMYLKKIILANDNDENIATSTSKTTKVTALGIGDCSMYAENDEIGLVIGEEYQVNILLDNENVTNLAGLSGTLTLPEGVKVVEGSDGKFVYSDRTPDPLVFKFQEFDGYTNFLLTSSNNTLITGISGTLFSFIVKADASLALTDKIKLSNLRVANTGGHSAALDDIVITVTNVKAQQLLEDKAAFETYKTEQVAAVEALAKDDDSEASAALITKAKDDINAAEYDEEKTLDENKKAVDAIVTKLESDLEAQRAADLLAANKEAFAAEQTAQKEAADALAKDGDSEAAAKLITDAKAAIDALTYDEEKTLDENKEAVGAIVTLLTSDLEAQRAAEKLAADKAAFDEYKAEQKTEVEKLAQPDDSEAAQLIVTNAKAEIDALAYDEEKSLDENKAAVDAITEPVEQALIDQRKNDADDLLAANEAAYETLSAQITALTEKLAEAQEAIAAYANEPKNMQAVVNEFQPKLDAIGDQIAAAEEKLEADKEELALAGKTQLEEKADIEAAIKEAVKDAETRYQVLQAQNAVRYMELEKAWNAYKADWQTRKPELLADYSDVAGQYAERIAAIDPAIEEIMTAITAAYESNELNSNKTLEDYGKVEVEDEIAAIVADAALKQKSFEVNAAVAALIEAAEGKLAAANTDIAKLNVKDDEDVVAAQEAAAEEIAAIKADLAARNEAQDLTDADQSAFATQITAFEAHVAALSDLAANNQKAYEANEAAHTTLVAQIAAAQAEIDAAKAEVNQNVACVSQGFEADFAALQDALDALTEQVEADYASRNLTAESAIDTKSLTDQLAAVKSNAAAAAAKYADLKARLEAVEAAEVEGELYTADATSLNTAKDALVAEAQRKLEDMTADVDFVTLQADYTADVAALEAKAETLNNDVVAAAKQFADDKAAFEAYKADQKAAAADLEKAEDTAAAKQDIADAQAAIGALTFDAGKNLAENKAAADEIVANLAEELDAERAAVNDAVYESLLAEFEDIDAAIAAAEETLADAKYALVSDEYKEQIADLKAEVEAAKADLDARHDAGTLTSASENIEFPAVDKVDAIVAAAEEAQKSVPGDIDDSGVIDFDDFESFVDELLENDEIWDAILSDDPETYEKYEKFDVNGDGYVDIADAQALMNLAAGLNIDGTLPSAIRARNAVAGTLTAAATNLGNGVTRYVISLDDSREFAAFQMQIAGEVLAVNSDDAKLMTKQTAKGMRVLGFANNEVLAKSQVLTVDVKGSAQFNHITFATLGATSVAFEINVATGINAMADQNNGAARYDLSGRKLQSAQKGVNVVRNADGQVRKVLVK